LPEREFFEGNQQVAMKLDDSTSLFFFAHCSQLIAFRRDCRDIPVTGEQSGNSRMYRANLVPGVALPDNFRASTPRFRLALGAQHPNGCFPAGIIRAKPSQRSVPVVWP
jgi:hypothetical protein